MPLPRTLPKAKAKPRQSRLGRPQGRFTQHKRLAKLREVLAMYPAGLGLNEIANALRVTTRSARRYLEYLVLDPETKEIESVHQAPGAPRVWRIKPSERGRALTLRRTQAYGLLALRKVFDLMRGSALYDELDVISRQLVQLAQRPTKGEIASDKGLEDRLLYVPEIQRSYTQKGAELDDIFRAVADLRVLRFRYAVKGASPSPHGVTLHPYAMLLHRGAVYCVGLDVAKNEVTTFLLDRMSETQASEAERFPLPDGFDAGEFLQGEFGIGRPVVTKRVLIEFEPLVGEEVRARRVHPSQKIAAAADGRVRLSMTVGDLDRVATWVLGFGGSARVIEPPELRAAVVKEMKRALGRYGE